LGKVLGVLIVLGSGNIVLMVGGYFLYKRMYNKPAAPAGAV